MINDYLKNNLLMGVAQVQLMKELNDGIHELKEIEQMRNAQQNNDFNFEDDANVTNEHFEFDYEDDFEF